MFKIVMDSSFEDVLDKFENVEIFLLEPTREIGGDVLLDLFDMNFAAEGPMWTPLAIRTQEEREQQGYDPDHPILERTGHLRYSVTDRNHPDHFEDIEWVGDATFRFLEGSDHPYFDLLHAGGMNQYNRPVPARPMAVVHDYQLEYLDKALERIAEATRGAILE